MLMYCIFSATLLIACMQDTTTSAAPHGLVTHDVIPYLKDKRVHAILNFTQDQTDKIVSINKDYEIKFYEARLRPSELERLSTAHLGELNDALSVNQKNLLVRIKLQARRTFIIFDSGLDREFNITNDQAKKYRMLSDDMEKRCIDIANANKNSDLSAINKISKLYRTVFNDMDNIIRKDILNKQQLDKYLSWCGGDLNVDFLWDSEISKYASYIKIKSSISVSNIRPKIKLGFSHMDLVYSPTVIRELSIGADAQNKLMRIAKEWYSRHTELCQDYERGPSNDMAEYHRYIQLATDSMDYYKSLMAKECGSDLFKKLDQLVIQIRGPQALFNSVLGLTKFRINQEQQNMVIELMDTAFEKCYAEPNRKLTGTDEEIKKQKAIHLNNYFEASEEAALMVMTPVQHKLWCDLIGKQYDSKIIAELRTFFKISEVNRVFP